MIWLALVAYALVGFIVACRVSSLLAWDWMSTSNRSWEYYGESGKRYMKQHPTGEQWMGGGMLGLCAGAVWPGVLLAALFRGRLFAPPRDVQRARDKARIEELERELEIGR